MHLECASTQSTPSTSTHPLHVSRLNQHLTVPNVLTQSTLFLVSRRLTIPMERCRCFRRHRGCLGVYCHHIFHHLCLHPCLAKPKVSTHLQTRGGQGGAKARSLSQHPQQTCRRVWKDCTEAIEVVLMRLLAHNIPLANRTVLGGGVSPVKIPWLGGGQPARVLGGVSPR